MHLNIAQYTQTLRNTVEIVCQHRSQSNLLIFLYIVMNITWRGRNVCLQKFLTGLAGLVYLALGLNITWRGRNVCLQKFLTGLAGLVYLALGFGVKIQCTLEFLREFYQDFEVLCHF